MTSLIARRRPPRYRWRRWLLLNFERVYRLDRRVRRRLTPLGYLVLVGLGTAAVIGLNTRLTLASQIFTLALGMAGLALLSGLTFRPRLRVSRDLPAFATAGEPLRYLLRVENLGPTTERGLVVTDELVETLPTLAQFLRYRDPADGRRNRFDRFVGYPRWLALVQRQQGAHEQDRPLPAIAGGARIDIPASLTPRRRGYLRFQGVRVSRSDPLGLFNAFHRLDAPGSLVVLPRRYPLRRLALSGHRLYQPGGVALAAANGDAEEFVSLRDYRPGDSLRDIHWKSWAKMNKPIVKEKRPEYFARHALILDTFAGVGQDAVFEEAVSVAASFVATLDTRESLLDLIFVGAQTYRFTAGRGLGDNAHLLKILACVEGIDEQAFARLRETVLAHAGQFNGCVLVLLGWDAPRQDLVRELRGRAIQTLALVIREDAAPPPAAADVVDLPLSRIAETLRQL